MKLFLTVVLIILGIILIILILFQSGRVKNLGSSIVGTTDIELFEQKKRGWNKWLHYITIGLVLLFVAIALTLVLI